MLKRVIITGGSGLVGRALGQRLSETEGAYETIVLSRNPSRVTGLPAGARAIGWDAKTAAGWGELADGAYAIINLAGENIGAGRWTAAKKASVIQSRVNAGQAVVEAITAAKIKPQVLVQASAIGFYGNRGDEVLTEASAAGDDFLAEVLPKVGRLCGGRGGDGSCRLFAHWCCVEHKVWGVGEIDAPDALFRGGGAGQWTAVVPLDSYR